MVLEVNADELLGTLLFFPGPNYPELQEYYSVPLRRDKKGLYVNIEGKRREVKEGDEVLTQICPEYKMRIKHQH